MTDPYDIIMEAGDVTFAEGKCKLCQRPFGIRDADGMIVYKSWVPGTCTGCTDVCERCGRGGVNLIPFGEFDSMLCEEDWLSAYFHRYKKRGECGVESCRVCYEVE